MSSMTSGKVNAIGRIFVKPGIALGNRAIKQLEAIFPQFQDVQEDLHGIRNPYLEKYNLSKKEARKRNIKHAIRTYFMVLSAFVGLTVLAFVFVFLENFLFHLSNLSQFILGLLLVSVAFVVLIGVFLFLFAAYRLYATEREGEPLS